MARTIAEIMELAKTDSGRLTAAEWKLLKSMKRDAAKEDKAGVREEQRARTKRIQQQIVSAGQEIGDLPPVEDQARRDSCAGAGGFKRFCETYLAAQVLPGLERRPRYRR